MMKSNASRVVLVMILGIAALELSLGQRFGQLWNLAFGAGSHAVSEASHDLSTHTKRTS